MKVVFVAFATKGIAVPINPNNGAIDVANINPIIKAHIASIIARISENGTIGMFAHYFLPWLILCLQP